MKAFVITISGHSASEAGARHCIQSVQDTDSELDVEIWPAVTPETLFDCDWTWPLEKKKICHKTNLTLTAYKNADPRRRIACAQSHWLLWQLCVELKQAICILEHDAVFTQKFVADKLDGGAVSINSPLGATFRDQQYDQALMPGLNHVPWVAEHDIPQGLPGNSAYVLQPWAAQQLIDAQQHIGWWPNDAIMCRQLFPWLRVLKPYCTTLQHMRSSTKH